MNFVLGLSQISDFFGDFFGGLMGWLGRMVYSLIICAIGRICDICQLVFKKFAGLENISLPDEITNGEKSGDIVLQFLSSDLVKNTFIALLVLAFVLLLITTFVAVIKTEFDAKSNSKKGVIKNAFKAIANFLIVPLVCVFGLIISNGLLKAIDGATNISKTNTTLSSEIFLAGGYNANRARTSEMSSGSSPLYLEGTFGKILTENTKAGNGSGGYGNFGIFYDDPIITAQKGSSAADKIDLAFSSGLKIDFAKDGAIENVNQRNLNYSAQSFYFGGKCLTYPKGGNENGGKLGFEDSITFDIYNTDLVYYYYDLTFAGFDYIVAAIALIFCAYVLLTLVLGLINRLFMLILLFIISPPIVALYPMDNGQALGRWRIEFVKQALSAYSVVVVMNIFLLLLPLMTKIEVFSGNELGFMSFTTGFANYIAKVLIIIGALTFFKQASSKVSEIIGAGDLAKATSDNLDGLKTNVAKTVAGGALIAGGLALGGKLVKGGANLIKDSNNVGFGRAVGERTEGIRNALGGQPDENGNRHYAKAILKAPGIAVHAVGSAINRTGNMFSAVSHPYSADNKDKKLFGAKGTIAGAYGAGSTVGGKSSGDGGKSGGNKGDNGNNKIGKNEIDDYLREDYKQISQMKKTSNQTKKLEKKVDGYNKKIDKGGLDASAIASATAKKEALEEQIKKNKELVNKEKIATAKNEHKKLTKLKNDELREEIINIKDKQAKKDAQNNKNGSGK